MSSPCAHVVCFILFDFSTFLSLLSIFSHIVLSFFPAINFIFHDVVDEFLVLMRTLALLPSTTLSQEISYNHCTEDNLLFHVLFPDALFAGDLHDSQSTSEGVLCTFGDRTFVPISWTCKEHPTVSHSTEAAVTSFFAGLRNGRFPSFNSMFLGFVDVLSPADKPGGDSTRNHSHVEPPHLLDLVPPKMHISNNRVHLFVFEDGMTILRKSCARPNMRHVSKTHQVP